MSIELREGARFTGNLAAVGEHSVGGPPFRLTTTPKKQHTTIIQQSASDVPLLGTFAFDEGCEPGAPIGKENGVLDVGDGPEASNLERIHIDHEGQRAGREARDNTHEIGRPIRDGCSHTPRHTPPMDLRRGHGITRAMDRATKEKLAKERRAAEAVKILSLAPELQPLVDDYKATKKGLREKEKAEWHLRVYQAFQRLLPDYKWTTQDGSLVKPRDHDVIAALLDTNVPDVNYARTIMKASEAVRLLRKMGLPADEIGGIFQRTRDVLWGLTDKGIPVSSVNLLQCSAVKDAEAGICTFEEAINRRATEALTAKESKGVARGSRGVWSKKAMTHVGVEVQGLPTAIQTAIDRHITSVLTHMEEAERLYETRNAQEGFRTVTATALAMARPHGGDPEHVPDELGHVQWAAGIWFMRALAHLPVAEQQTLSADAVLGITKQWEGVAERGEAARKKEKARLQSVVRPILDRLGVATIMAAEKALRATIAETHPDRGGDATRFAQARNDLLVVQNFKRASAR